MKRLFNLMLLLVALAVSQSAMAWGAWGHHISAYIAEQHLTPEAKAKCEHYLQHSLPHYSSWMDHWRNSEPFKETTYWHMNRVDKNFNTIGNQDISRDAVTQLERVTKEMCKGGYKNLSDSLVAVNLKYIIHMVGDMHCPSHIFYTEFEDCFSGVVNGKKVRRHDQMKVYYNGKKTTSHRVWDGLSIREIWPEYGSDYDKFRVALDKVKAKKREKMCKGTIEQWALQNAKDIRYIYDVMTPNCKVDRQFLLDNQKLSKQQCLRASYRLAHILNECFK